MKRPLFIEYIYIKLRNNKR